MSFEPHNNFDETIQTGDNFLRDVAPEEARPAVATSPLMQRHSAMAGSSNAAGGDIDIHEDEEPVARVYTQADAPNFTMPGDDEEEQPAPQKPEEKKAQQMGAQFMVGFIIDLADMGMKRACANMAKTDNLEKWALQADEKQRLSEAGINYANSIDLAMSPLQVLLLAVAMVYGPRIYTAKQEGNERMERMQQVQQNAGGLGNAMYQANTELVEKERTNYNIYTNTGAYHKNRYGQHCNQDVATEKPDFRNPAEIKEVIKANGLDKVKRAYPELAQTIDNINAGKAL